MQGTQDSFPPQWVKKLSRCQGTLCLGTLVGLRRECNPVLSVPSTFQARPLHHLSAPPPQRDPHPSPAQPRLQPPLLSVGRPSPHTQWVPLTNWDLTCLQPLPQHPALGGLQPPICTCPLSSSVNPERSGGSSGQPPNRVCWWRGLAPRELEVSTGAIADQEELGDTQV